MLFLLDHPVALFASSFLFLWLSALLGVFFRKRRPERAPLVIEDHEFDLVVGGTLTLLGLIIGFTFSMAVSRYDQRKNYEEAEANAIGTEYVRADLLSPAEAARVRSLLRAYLDERILYYRGRRTRNLAEVRSTTAQLESSLWSAVTPVATERDAISALVLSGMNDVINSEGYTEAAWRNRVPLAAWLLLISIALVSNLMLGYRAERKGQFLLIILPLALSISLFLIADIDSPRTGVIRVHPQNLESLADSLRPH